MNETGVGPERDRSPVSASLLHAGMKLEPWQAAFVDRFLHADRMPIDFALSDYRRRRDERAYVEGTYLASLLFNGWTLDFGDGQSVRATLGDSTMHLIYGSREYAEQRFEQALTLVERISALTTTEEDPCPSKSPKARRPRTSPPRRPR